MTAQENIKGKDADLNKKKPTVSIEKLKEKKIIQPIYEDEEEEEEEGIRVKPQELATMVNESLMKIKQKKIPFQSFTSKLKDYGKFIEYLFKYGELKYEQIDPIIEELTAKKEELKQIEREKIEKDIKDLLEKKKKFE